LIPLAGRAAAPLEIVIADDCRVFGALLAALQLGLITPSAMKSMVQNTAPQPDKCVVQLT
jgi:hypothetical protein